VAADPRVDPPLHGDEVTILRSFLTFHRDTLRWKCSGLTPAQLARPLPPSEMTLGGMMKHLALVESNWFDSVFSGVDLMPPFDTVDWDADRDWEWHSARDDSPEELRTLFDEAVRRADAVVDEALTHAGLEQESARKSRHQDSTFTLRWILVHLIEEVGRHAGHADILREQIDGRTGR
jgi:uncharacterized damage-inducible protein DinB